MPHRDPCSSSACAHQACLSLSEDFCIGPQAFQCRDKGLGGGDQWECQGHVTEPAAFPRYKNPKPIPATPAVESDCSPHLTERQPLPSRQRGHAKRPLTALADAVQNHSRAGFGQPAGPANAKSRETPGSRSPPAERHGSKLLD